MASTYFTHSIPGSGSGGGGDINSNMGLYELVPSNITATIGTYRQYLIHELIEIQGLLDVNGGTLVVMNGGI